MPKIKKRNSAKKRNPGEEIHLLADRLSDFAETHRKSLNIIGMVAAVVLILAAGYWLMVTMQERKAAPLADTAYALYEPEAGMSPDYQKALDLFREVRKKYPLTRSAARAQFYIGNCLMAMGRNADALKEYKVFTDKYSGYTFLLGLVYERMGYADLDLGKQADAIKAFQHSEAITGPGAATLELARLYESSGNIIESQKKYKEIVDKLGGTEWAMEAMGKVQQISTTKTPTHIKVNK